MSVAITPDDIIPPLTDSTSSNPNNELATSSMQVETLPKRDARGRLLPGNSANLHGGRKPKRVREFEKMLKHEHQNIDNLRAVFARLRALALGESTIVVAQGPEGELKLEAKLVADPAFMKLYLDRVLGPVKAADETLDLSDAPVEVLEYLRVRVLRK